MRLYLPACYTTAVTLFYYYAIVFLLPVADLIVVVEGGSSTTDGGGGGNGTSSNSSTVVVVDSSNNVHADDVCHGEFGIEMGRCLVEHGCECAECNYSVDYLTLTNILWAGQQIPCSQIHETYCPSILCCPACSRQRQTVVHCVELRTFEQLIEANCLLDCTDYELPSEEDEDVIMDEEELRQQEITCINGCGSEWAIYERCNRCEGVTDFSIDGVSEQVNLLTTYYNRNQQNGNGCSVIDYNVCSEDGSSHLCNPNCKTDYANWVQCVLDTKYRMNYVQRQEQQDPISTMGEDQRCFLGCSTLRIDDDELLKDVVSPSISTPPPSFDDNSTEINGTTEPNGSTGTITMMNWMMIAPLCTVTLYFLL